MEPTNKILYITSVLNLYKTRSQLKILPDGKWYINNLKKKLHNS